MEQWGLLQSKRMNPSGQMNLEIRQDLAISKLRRWILHAHGFYPVWAFVFGGYI